MQQDCSIIENKFREKFGVLPYITFENLSGYGNMFCIWKSPNICLDETKAFYKMGSTYEQAINYVSGLITIPSAIITFQEETQKESYALELETSNLNMKLQDQE